MEIPLTVVLACVHFTCFHRHNWLSYIVMPRSAEIASREEQSLPTRTSHTRTQRMSIPHTLPPLRPLDTTPASLTTLHAHTLTNHPVDTPSSNVIACTMCCCLSTRLTLPARSPKTTASTPTTASHTASTLRIPTSRTLLLSHPIPHHSHAHPPYSLPSPPPPLTDKSKPAPIQRQTRSASMSTLDYDSQIPHAAYKSPLALNSHNTALKSASVAHSTSQY